MGLGIDTRRAESTLKHCYQALKYGSSTQKTIGLIMGVQRSGTGMLTEAFNRDWACHVFGEDGGLALGADAGEHSRWRWKPLPEVELILNRQRAPLLIAKPLVESQHAERILAQLPQARIIWAYRHFQEVALSSQEHFGASPIHYNLTSIIEGRSHWYSENVSGDVRAVVHAHYRKDRSPHDLKALGWWVRNSLVFNYQHLPLTLIRYENLVLHPSYEMRRLYRFLQFRYPGDRIVQHVHSRSVQRARNVVLSDDIKALCEAMLQELDSLAERMASVRNAHATRRLAAN